MKIHPFKGLINSKIGERRFYLYQIEQESCLITGLICSLPIENVNRKKVVRHEQIFPENIAPLYEDFIHSRLQKNPILVITDEDQLKQKINELLPISKVISEKKLDTGEIHRILALPTKTDILFIGFKSLCVADGHHRLSALLKYYEIFPTKSIEQSAIMASIFHVKGLNTRTKGIIFNNFVADPSSFLETLSLYFDIQPNLTPRIPVHNHNFELLLCNQWFTLSLKPQLIQKDHQHNLGIEIFREFVLKSLFHVNTYTNHPHIKIVFEKCNFSALEQAITSPQQIGFVISSDPIQKILNIARAGRLLEPNSTYFEPKFIPSMIEYPLGAYDY